MPTGHTHTPVESIQKYCTLKGGPTRPIKGPSRSPLRHIRSSSSSLLLSFCRTTLSSVFLFSLR